MTKICPLMCLGHAGPNIPCLRDECAWWVHHGVNREGKTHGVCAIVKIAKEES